MIETTWLKQLGLYRQVELIKHQSTYMAIPQYWQHRSIPTNSWIITGGLLISLNAAFLFTETHTATLSCKVMGRFNFFRERTTTEDKVIVRTGGLVFTSSPTASISESFHRNHAALLLIWTGNSSARGFKSLRQLNADCRGIKPKELLDWWDWWNKLHIGCQSLSSPNVQN